MTKRTPNQNINSSQQSSGSGGGDLSESPSPSGSFKTTLNPSVPFTDPENVLQAVVLADSFNERFMPITLENPRCFLPLVNVALIEYTFEFLAVSGVQEIFVFCCAHHEKIVQYLSESKWTQPYSPFRVHTLVSQSSMGVGDAMREIDSLSLIRGDFILLSGDIVSNINLKDIVEQHRALRQKDKNVLMTMVVKEADPKHRIRSISPETVMIIDHESGELLKYDIGIKDKYTELPLEILHAHPVVQFRADLLDCEIDICSPEVLALFTENFDYQHMRKHFVKGILESDILGKKIQTRIIKDQYAARVGSIPAYDVITKDILKRWTFPLVPDSNLIEGTNYAYSRHHIYKDSDIVLARSCVLHSNVVIGKGSKIGADTHVSDSIIGEGCIIGSGVTLKGAYLWKNVVIGDNSSITNSVLCDHVVVKQNVVINKGCILSYRVVVGPNLNIKEFTRVSLRKRKSEEDDDGDGDDDVDDNQDDDDDLLDGEELGSSIVFDEELVGKEGRGYAWHEADKEDSENQGIQLFLGETREEEAEASSDSSEEEEQFIESDADRFQREAVETVKRSIEEKHSIENTALEINALKFAYNSSFKDCYYAIFSAMFELIDNANPTAAIKEVFKNWSDLLSRFIQKDQYEAIMFIQDFSVTHEIVSKYFSPILQILYDKDVFEEGVILKWHNSKEASKELKQKAQKFVQWLEEAEEDEDED